MGEQNQRRSVRERILAALRRELMGPRNGPDEEIEAEFPTTRYIMGRLAPQGTPVGQDEDDQLQAGDDDDEAGAEDSGPAISLGFSPSSFGLSFLVSDSVTSLDVELTWGDYIRVKRDDGKSVWKRHPQRTKVAGLPVAKTGRIQAIPLIIKVAPSPGPTVEGTEASQLFLEGVVHRFSGYRAISLFLVNRREKVQPGDKSSDERWVYQPRMLITSPGKESVFVAKDVKPTSAVDPEDASNNLLYRHVKEFATGHGVAPEWVPPTGDGDRVAGVWTEFMPAYELPTVIASSAVAEEADLDMKSLAECPTQTKCTDMLSPLLTAYSNWIEELEKASQSPEIQASQDLREAARGNIDACKECFKRIKAGLDLVGSDQGAFEAFRFANRSMWDQRIHSIWASRNSERGQVKGSASEYDLKENRTWRPFQMGFILLNLVGIARPESDDRRLVDLLWFPTGGGKTEAYLGLAAFAMALRRLKATVDSDHGAGVNVMMRYTLRLLTVQQFQRAAALICSCELLRRKDPDVWGAELFRIGLWVGRGTTPNTHKQSQDALESINDGKKPKEGSPVQIVACPRCGTALVTDKGKPLSQTYIVDDVRKRTLIGCPNPKCEFRLRESDEGLPVVVVDDEIYRTCPTMVIATVDKFARMPFKGETQSLFGRRDRFSSVYGHLTEAHGDKVEGRKIKDAQAAEPLPPPNLIIQDELHLISGPLGTMVGLYETAVDRLSGSNAATGLSVPAKVIASTATIRRAAQQAQNLYARELRVFPPSGITAQDSFFAREVKIDAENDYTSGRIYVGIYAPGSSGKTAIVRTYASLLAASQKEIEVDASLADPYGTLVGYFNSLRSLGGAKRLTEDDVQIRLKYLRQRWPRRPKLIIEELTSRLDSWQIPPLLKRLKNTFPRGKTDWPLDVLLATNMISVGVDIDRLGLMVVNGQPKATAEYIQATSRVGRKFPGLVVTIYNWVGARDLSHYERFHSYHAALYKYVEAISVTPFSSRALDRGLAGMFAGMMRLGVERMPQEPQAQNFDAAALATDAVIANIVARAEDVVGKGEAALVKDRLLALKDEWAQWSEDPLRYSWLFNGQQRKPPNNTRVLISTAGTDHEGEWKVPGSLREVEAAAGFYLLGGNEE